MAEYIILPINSNQGYSPEQVMNESITLGDLLAAVQEAIETHGAETKIVLSNGQRYGAGYGNISQWQDIFEEPEEDEDRDDYSDHQYLRP